MSGGSFGASSYQLRSDLALSIVLAGEAHALGALFAGMDPWRRYLIGAAELAAFFSAIEPGASRFAIRHDGQLAGGVVVRSNWFRGPYIQTFALAPERQGRGIGSAVVAFIEREARAHGDRQVWVAASDFNTRAIAFYERHGFARVAAIDGLLRDDRTEILLRRKLYAG
jgi:diamine N-acetyltransferase